MSQKPLYFVISLDLEEERSQNKPYILFNTKDYFYILTLTGEAELSVNDEDYFPLKQGMRILLPKEERKNFKVINSSQPGKNLTFLLGTQGEFEVAK